MTILRGAMAAIALMVSAPITSSAIAQTHALREVGPAERASWQYIADPRVTANGRFLVYILRTLETASSAHAFLVAVEISTGRTQSIDLEASSAEVQEPLLSSTGNWVAVPTPRPDGFSETILLDLSSDQRVNLRDYIAVGFREGSDSLLLFNATAKTLTLRMSSAEGSSREEIIARDVDHYSASPDLKFVAWSNTTGISVTNLDTQRTHLVSHQRSNLLGASWSPSNSSLAVYQSAANNPTDLDLLIIRDLDADATVSDVLSQDQLIEGARHFRPSPPIGPATLMWRADGSGLFFTITPVEPANTLLAPSPVIWRWDTPRIATGNRQQQMFLAFYSVQEKHWRRLATESVPHVSPHPTGNFLLGYNAEKYARPESPNLSGTTRTPQLRDYSLIDIRTGHSFPIISRLPVIALASVSFEPLISPNGSAVLFEKDGDYFSFDVNTRATRNLTRGLPSLFYYPENNRNQRTMRERGWFGSPLQGWAEGGRTAVLQDGYDLWAIPLDGRVATRLTAGRQSGIGFEVLNANSPAYWHANSPLDLSRMLFRAIDMNTGRTGIAEWPETNAEISWVDGYVRCFFTTANVRICEKAASTEVGDFYLADEHWALTQRLTNTNPTQPQYSWPAGARYLSYQLANGTVLHGVLMLPAGYRAGTRYPTIVDIYERRSQAVHGYIGPSAEWFWYLEHGYAILLPDIQPRVGEPGPAALEAVERALEAASASGVTDMHQLGIMGHSYGAFETLYIISHSSLFSAAVAEAGVADLWSNYGQTWAGGTPNSYVFEHEQPYMAAPWWDDWNAYLQNSPLYSVRNIHTPLLLAHGDVDAAVSFSQSVELFSSMQRLGDRPVVLLQYPGEDHVLGDEATSDLANRKREFFDHFLRDGPAPEWWDAANPANR
jgi:dipeptidyl aminopeptidase/acylaminoacyl peptidase